MNRTMGLAPDLATFERLVNTRFVLRPDPETSVEIELVEVRRVSTAPSYEAFSLLFQAPATAPSEQRIYALESEATGAFELFLVPIGRTETGIRFEAVFNRRNEPTAGGR